MNENDGMKALVDFAVFVLKKGKELEEKGWIVDYKTLVETAWEIGKNPNA